MEEAVSRIMTNEKLTKMDTKEVMGGRSGDGERKKSRLMKPKSLDTSANQ